MNAPRPRFFGGVAVVNGRASFLGACHRSSRFGRGHRTALTPEAATTSSGARRPRGSTACFRKRSRSCRTAPGRPGVSPSPSHAGTASDQEDLASVHGQLPVENPGQTLRGPDQAPVLGPEDPELADCHARQAHLHDAQGVRGSSPLRSTRSIGDRRPGWGSSWGSKCSEYPPTHTNHPWWSLA
jgi:hypothetical protein